MDRKRKETLTVLCGGEVPTKVSPTLSNIADCLDRPVEFTEKVENICESEDSEEYRYHLVRMQIYSELNIREDVDYHSRRLWIAQTLEKLIFGKLKIDGSSDDEES